MKGELSVDSGHFETVGTSLPELGDDVEVEALPGEALVARKQVPLPLDLDLKLDLGSRLTVRARVRRRPHRPVRVYTGSGGEVLAEGVWRR